MVRQRSVPGDLAAQLATSRSSRARRPSPPTAGPPRDMAATIGAIATAWCDPKREPNGQRRSQQRQDDPEDDARERSGLSWAVGFAAGQRELDSAILQLGGNRKVATTSANALSVTTPAMYTLSDRGIDASYDRAIYPEL